MTKQELEKAIENKDTIWYIDSLYDTPKDMLLHGIYEINSYIYEDVGRVYYLKDVERNSYYRMDYMFKTQAQAKHYSYRSNISRTEHLPFLTWEEFKKKKIFRFVSASGTDCFMQLIENKQVLFYYGRGKVESATEENFYKLYDDCVKCFKEEE